MTVSSSFSRVFFAAAVAFSILCALHTGHVLAITSPRLPSHRHERQASSLGSLGVDEEGNLLWCNNSHESPSDAESASSTSKQPLSSVLKSLRGGDLCVDGEGNLYTPRRAAPTTQKTAPTTPSRPLSPTTEALRGGSVNGGQLQVDSEGNLFYSGPTNSAAIAATSLRGGELSVDNEGNFFTPRQAPSPQHTDKEGPLLANRRGSRDDTSSVVLAKNEHSKNIHTNNKAPKKNDASGETPMAFIGFNNALMET